MGQSLAAQKLHDNDAPQVKVGTARISRGMKHCDSNEFPVAEQKGHPTFAPSSICHCMAIRTARPMQRSRRPTIHQSSVATLPAQGPLAQRRASKVIRTLWTRFNRNRQRFVAATEKGKFDEKLVRNLPLKPHDARRMQCYAVRARINHMVNDDAGWSAPVELADIQRGPVLARADFFRQCEHMFSGTGARPEGIPGGLARSSQNRGRKVAKIGAKNDPLLTTWATSRFPLEFA